MCVYGMCVCMECVWVWNVCVYGMCVGMECVCVCVGASPWNGGARGHDWPRGVSANFIDFPSKCWNSSLFVVTPCPLCLRLTTVVPIWEVKEVNFCSQCLVQVSQLQMWHHNFTSTLYSSSYAVKFLSWKLRMVRIALIYIVDQQLLVMVYAFLILCSKNTQHLLVLKKLLRIIIHQWWMVKKSSWQL